MTTRMSVREVCAAYAAAKSPATRKELLAYAEARAKESSKEDWKRLPALLAGDAATLKARAEGRKTYWDAKAASRPAKPAKDAPKPVAKVAAKPTPVKAAKPVAKPADPMVAAAQALGVAPEKMAAFAALVAFLR